MDGALSDTKPKKRRKLKEAEAVELEPDAWERFEEAVHKVAPPKRALVSKIGQGGRASEVPVGLSQIMQANSLALEALTSESRDSRLRRPTQGQRS